MKESLKKLIENNSYFKLDNFLIHCDSTLDFFKNIASAKFESIKESISISTYSNWNNLLIKDVTTIKQRLSSFLEINVERIGEFNLLSFNDNTSFSKISCLENTTEYSIFLFPNTEEISRKIIFSNTIHLDVNNFTLLIVKNYELKKCLDNLSFLLKDGYVLIGYILDNTFIDKVSEQNNSRKLNKSKHLLFDLEHTTDYSKDDMIGYISSLYSVCSCRIDKYNRRKIQSKENLVHTITDNVVLSYHFVCSEGAFNIIHNGSEYLVSKGQVLSIDNNTNSKSLISELSIVNLTNNSKLDIYMLYLNKIQ